MSEWSLAVLDDYANISPRHFAHLGEKGLIAIDYYPDTLNPASGEEDLARLVQRLRRYRIISSMRERTPFPAALLEQLPALRLLMTTGTRNRAIDLEAAAARGIPVTGTKGDRPAPSTHDAATAAADEDEVSLIELPPPPGHSTVIQHAWGLLLALSSRIPQDDRNLRTPAGPWQTGLMTSLAGKTLGVVGLGKLGIAFGKIGAQSFGMRVVAWSASLTQAAANDAAEAAGLPRGSFHAVAKEELFRTADVVSLHYVLSERSRGLVGPRELGWMKRSAMLLNTSRAGLIDEAALMEVLCAGRIRGFATDVFWEEPLPSDNAWRRVDAWAQSQVVMSPHMAYVNEGTLHRWYQEQAQILEDFLHGKEIAADKRLN